MSQELDLEAGGVRGNTYQDLPPAGENQPQTGEPNFRDSPGPLVSTFSRIAEEDSKMAGRWQKDADGILVFTGLFSAAVAALLAITVPGLRPDPQTQYTSAFYLDMVYQILADSGFPRAPSAPFPSAVAISRPFSPPRYVVWVNSLWVLSLVISLTCAGLATLVQQWARRYVKFIGRPRYGPHQRMRVRTFFSYGVNKFRVSWLIWTLILLIHISLIFFFAGLLVFLSAVNLPLFGAVASWMVLSTMAYVLITLLPIFLPNSPYYTPFSSIVWALCTGTAFLFCKLLSSPLFGTRHHFRRWKDQYYEQLVEGMGKTAEKTASQRSLEIDVRVMMSTLDAVADDDALAEFFESIPSFFNSDQVKNLEECLVEEFQIKLGPALNSFLDRTFSSDSISDSVKSSRLVGCLNATHAVLGSDRVSQILFGILNGRWQQLFQSVEVAASLRQWSKNTNDEYLPFVQRVVTQVIASTRECDERWISLVVEEFKVPDHVLRGNMGHGVSMLLSLLLYMTRQANVSGSWMPWVLSSLCQFDVCSARLELQYEFCDLWNVILRKAWKDGRTDSTAVSILREIRHAYIGLHQGTDAAPIAFSARTLYFNPVLAQPQSYRFCNIASHRPHVTHQAPFTAPPTTASTPSFPPSTAQPGGSPNPIPRVTPSTDFPSRRSAHTLTHRHTYPSSLSPSPPPVQSSQRTTSVDAAYVPESIEFTTMRDHTLHQRNPLVLTEVSRHAPRRATLSVSTSAVNIARPHKSTRYIHPNEREETSQAPATASLSTLSLPTDTPPFTDSPSSIGPGVPSFSWPGPVHTSPYPMDQTPPVDTPDALPPVRVTTSSSRPLGSNGRPAVLKEDIVVPSSAKPILRTILPNSGGATPQRKEDTTTVVPPITQLSPVLLPPLCGDMTPTELRSLRSVPPSPSTAVSHSPLQSVRAVHVTEGIGTLSTSDGTRDSRSYSDGVSIDSSWR